MKYLLKSLLLLCFCIFSTQIFSVTKAAKQKEFNTRLVVAVNSGKLGDVKQAIEQGADPNAKTSTGKLVLTLAVDAKNDEIIQYLLDHGADPLKRDKDGQRPLDYAQGAMRVKLDNFLRQKKSKENVTPSQAQSKEVKAQPKVVVVTQTKLKETVSLPQKQEKLKQVIAPSKVVVAKNAQQKLRDKALVVAADSGDLEKIKSAIEQGADLNAKSSSGKLALALAIEKNKADVVQYLLDKGADPLKRDKQGKRPLDYAQGAMRVTIDNFLRQKESKENVAPSQAQSKEVIAQPQAVVEADKKENVSPSPSPEKPKEAISQQPKVIIPNEDSIFEAAKKGNLARINALIESGASINVQDKLGRTALSYAAEKGRYEIVKKFIELNAQVDLADEQGNTPLYYAISNRHAPIVTLLINAHADPNKRNKNGKSPFDVAITNSYLDFISSVIKAKSDLESPDADGNTPFLLAVKVGNVAIVKRFIEAKVNVLARNKKGNNALDIAREHHHDEILQLLEGSISQLPSQPQVGSVKKVEIIHDPFASIWDAIAHQDLKTIEWYLNFGLSPNAHINGKTLLIEAAKQGKLQSVELLVSKGAKIEQEDSEGYTALGWAARNGHVEVVKFLILKNADVNHPSKDWGMTPLLSAAAGGHVEIAEMLIYQGADVNVQDNHRKRTPLNWVVRMTVGSVAKKAPQMATETAVKLVRLLLDYGADQDIVDYENKTPLQRAIDNRHKQIADILRAAHTESEQVLEQYAIAM